ncbi:MAG: hypothetical protein G01um101419_705 [Parcubacteria group bacterium Gr01-1014_19]|nr:MAG: hypothetical protein G01um101419_705 [Parcubacteria group bacterium Gr01-1014_19]
MAKNIFESFLNRVLKKIAPPAAFDLGRDAQIKAIVSTLVKKEIISQAEYDQQVEQEFTKSAEMIEKMPPMPK